MRKVLVVDDAIFMRLSIKTSLERNGFEVVGEAGDGREAVKKFAILKPDIVTLDITMPEMSGIDTLRAMMQLDKDAKVVMVSAMGQEDKVRDAIMYGAKSFIVKPFKEEQLIKTLEKIIPA